LGDAGADAIKTILLASSTFPYADLQNAALVASALDAPARVRTVDCGGSQRAGASALLQALLANEAALVIGSDAPLAKPASVQELSYGAGAAAFTVGSVGVIAQLVGAGSVSEPFVDHFRASGAKHDYFWEERWIRDEGYARIAPAAVAMALENARLSIGDIAHFVMPSLLRGASDAVAKKIRFAGEVAPPLDDGVGYAGAAHVLLMLAHTLERAKPGERLLVVGFGQGADALVLEVTGAIAEPRLRRGVSTSIADGLATDSYLRMLSFYEGIDLEWGMRAEKSGKSIPSEQSRSTDQIAAFVAGACGACGTVQFPRLQACVKCQASAAGFRAVPLRAAPARVLTSTADWLSYHPAPPLHVGFVQFDNGARVLMEMVDVGPAGVERDQPLRMVYRIKERDRLRGYNRYFWKATPVAAA
jgi:3-hydroxy-3-methylglutaryl CoA synthase